MTRKRPRGADEPSGAWNAAGIVFSEVPCTLPVLSGSTAIAVVLGDDIMEKNYRGDARQWWRRLVSNVAPPRLVLPQYRLVTKSHNVKPAVNRQPGFRRDNS